MARTVHYSSISLPIISLILFAIVFWRRYVYLIPVIIIGGMLLGLWRGSLMQDDLSVYKPLFGQSVLLSGKVMDDVDTGSSGLIVIRLGDVKMGDKQLPGTMYITAGNAEIKRGDYLELSGKLMRGFGNFSAVMYRADIERIIQPVPGDTARQIRDWFAVLVRRVIPEPESSLGIGYLVGQRRALPADLVTALKIAGLTHIVVASGYNLTILVRLARKLFEKVSKYLSALASVAMIAAFCAITGLSPSMMRAGLVSLLCLAAWYYGRQFHPIILLLIAVAVTVMINPTYAWGDLGWQLSFAAFAGVMVLAPLATKYLFGDDKPGFIRKTLIETMSAQIVTAPILIMAFGQLSNVAIISNILILPLVPYAMLFVFIAGLGSVLLPFLAGLIALPAVWLLKYMVTVAEYSASLPWATSTVQIYWWGGVIAYVAIIGICVYMWRVTGYNLRESSMVE